jgi:hypothetical protein
MIKLSFTIFILIGALFASNDIKDEVQFVSIDENWLEKLNDAAQEGNEESVKLLLKGENEIIIEYLIKDYHENKSTALHYATKKGHKEIIKLL